MKTVNVSSAKCGEQQVSPGAKSTIEVAIAVLTLKLSDGQASRIIDELQWLAILYSLE